MATTLHGQHIDDFTQAYLEAALWTEDPQPGQGEYQADLSIIPPDVLASAIEDCRDFQEAQAAILRRAYLSRDESYTDVQAGHDFWLTRNGHGAGFWDRGLGTVGAALTAAAKVYGGCADFYFLFDRCPDCGGPLTLNDDDDEAYKFCDSCDLR